MNLPVVPPWHPPSTSYTSICSPETFNPYCIAIYLSTLNLLLRQQNKSDLNKWYRQSIHYKVHVNYNNFSRGTIFRLWSHQLNVRNYSRVHTYDLFCRYCVSASVSMHTLLSHWACLDVVLRQKPVSQQQIGLKPIYCLFQLSCI
jgi:hypothetical protein